MHRWHKAMAAALFAALCAAQAARADADGGVCHPDRAEALKRFLSAYEEAFDTLVVTRSIPDTHPYARGRMANFVQGAAQRVAARPGTLFLVYHLDDAAVCVFGWHAPDPGRSDGRAVALSEVRESYFSAPIAAATLDAQIAGLIGAMQASVMRGGAVRAPERGVTALQRSTGLSPAQVDDLLRGLSRSLLFDRLEPALADTRQIVMHLPGNLAALPMLALPRADGAALVGSHSLTLLDRLTRYLEDDVAAPVVERRADGRLVLVSDPATPPGGIGGMRFPALPGARREVALIEALYRAETGRAPAVLDGPDATAERVLDLIGDAEIVHFAGHGVGDADAPLEGSFLALADGALTAREITDIAIDFAMFDEVMLQNTPLVVLSACETGRGQALAAGMIGLARAFQVAGAGGTILSHWAVSDESAAVLMVALHEELVAAPSPEIALQRAMNRARADYPDPADWAAFSFFGLPGLRYGQGG